MIEDENICIKHATGKDIDACFQIRRVVFILEQNVPEEMERDSFDAQAVHFIVFFKQQPIATLRVVLKDDGKTGKIGRVAVLKEFRGQGIGARLMAEIERSSAARGLTWLVLTSQTHAVPFYEKRGYTTYGAEFMEAGIPHFSMRKRLYPEEMR